MQSLPNCSYVQGDVLEISPSSDNWGAWISLHVTCVSELATQANWCQDLLGKTVSVFAPPPWVDTLKLGSWTGHLMFKSGPFSDGVYSITQPNFYD